MCVTHAVLMKLVALGSIIAAVSIPAFWFYSVLYLATLVLVWVFIYDLVQLKREIRSAMIYVTNPAPTNTHIHIPGPAMVSTGQYGQQYGPQYENQAQESWDSASSSAPIPPPPYQNENNFMSEKVAIP